MGLSLSKWYMYRIMKVEYYQLLSATSVLIAPDNFLCLLCISLQETNAIISIIDPSVMDAHGERLWMIVAECLASTHL